MTDQAKSHEKLYFGAHGKLLLTGEYLVLKGARALSVPVKYKQWMVVERNERRQDFLLDWSAKNRGAPWFSVRLDEYLETAGTDDMKKADYLKQTLRTIKGFNENFLHGKYSYSVYTDTDFPVEWGLGTSATFLVNLAKWADIDPFKLFFSVSEGSGFDIASVLSEKPVVYRLEHPMPVYEETGFFPPFYKNLFFVYLGKKSDTAQNVSAFLRQNEIIRCDIEFMNRLTDAFIRAENLNSFKIILNEHENLLSYILKIPGIKHYFPDFDGEMKSLGAWGGDFILVTWEKPVELLHAYFRKKGIETIIPFQDMIL